MVALETGVVPNDAGCNHTWDAGFAGISVLESRYKLRQKPLKDSTVWFYQNYGT